MKRIFQLIWPWFLFPVLYLPYSLLNAKVIVDWLGCGCPSLDAFGNAVYSAFNANDFTRLFWSIITLIVIGISVYKSKQLSTWYYKGVYITVMAAISLCTALWFYSTMQWK